MHSCPQHQHGLTVDTAYHRDGGVTSHVFQFGDVRLAGRQLPVTLRASDTPWELTLGNMLIIHVLLQGVEPCS